MNVQGNSNNILSSSSIEVDAASPAQEEIEDNSKIETKDKCADDKAEEGGAHE